MTPLLAVLVLQYTWVHICIPNYCANIEPSVNDFLSIGSILHVPNINPYDGHIRFGGYLDDA